MNPLFAALCPPQATGRDATHGGLKYRCRGDVETAGSSAAEPPGACGWFDSSHELQQGLRVTEHSSAEALGAELPLADWLHLHLGGWVGGLRAEA